MSILLVDDIGQPIPQTLDKSTNKFKPLYSTDGAMDVAIKNFPSVFKAATQLVTSAGEPLPVGLQGIPVIVNAGSLVLKAFDGSGYVDVACNRRVVTHAAGSYTAASKVKVKNTNGKSLIVIVDTTDSSITEVGLYVPKGSNEVLYKTLTLVNGIAEFGLGSVNTGVLPAEFSINAIIASGSKSFSMEIQLV